MAAVVIALGAINYACGQTIIYRLDYPKVLFWVFLSAFKTIFIAIIINRLLRINKKLNTGKVLKGEHFVFNILLASAPLFLPLLGIWYIWFYSIKFTLLTLIAAIPAWLSMGGILCIHKRLKVMFVKLRGGLIGNDDSKLIKRFLIYRRILQQLLTINATIIGLSTLSAGAMRNAILQTEVGVEVPMEYVLIYGVYFTFILSVTYLPAYLLSLKVGKLVVEHHWSMKACEDLHINQDSWIKWYGHRKQFQEFLGLDDSAVSHLQKSFSIFTPAIGSIVSLLIGYK